MEGRHSGEIDESLIGRRLRYGMFQEGREVEKRRKTAKGRIVQILLYTTTIEVTKK